ncbi:hypothetical protein [Longispora fulva]|uniref:Uncharacterized protein n=1 Tax=Longispora fulva TaxID=619741 RepID=A0A8J7KJ30_9ACTN|nr:hypothetical protein [Longispora fulva]MBG6139980.1 hypothetical protein [Longispora fulva]
MPDGYRRRRALSLPSIRPLPLRAGDLTPVLALLHPELPAELPLGRPELAPELPLR